ncbi:hypothetical protein EVC27_029 [Rhizobium phage RHph_I1_6]|uniref:Uncharacterized protein n=1 Tax=Rhizobium phage RHph_I1_6 TaxID=2509728 RepID=A0A7S5V0Y6_9CAUD|nr:hypothetical protein PP745_gp029 [Rhizobium phage RHph_I1_6]QIG76554.1 hypothetical protein EVC27_029 [Rhizobium phage RHph_I1_6]
MLFNYKPGDKVIYLNDFGVCWGVKIITEQADWGYGPAYLHEGSDTPWYRVPERNYLPADEADLTASNEQLQSKYGFTPTEWFGCY